MGSCAGAHLPDKREPPPREFRLNACKQRVLDCRCPRSRITVFEGSRFFAFFL
jgi:hypothetical protein